MRDIIYSSFRVFTLWVLLCRKFQTHESRLKQNDILFHPLLILKIPFSKEIFNLNYLFWKKKIIMQQSMLIVREQIGIKTQDFLISIKKHLQKEIQFK